MKSKNNFQAILLFQFLRRLHTFVGIFIGPFIIIASITGALYGISFALENWLYKDILTVSNNKAHQDLASQVKRANEVVGSEGKLLAIRPAPSQNETSRILYTSEKLKSSEYRTIFLNPSTLEVKADMITYGSTGALPLRTTIDLLHRDFLLGDFGRWYSELAASWLWLTGVSGLILYFRRRKTKFIQSKNHYQKLVNKHIYLGIFCFAALVMLSITGLTWSQYAGDNIDKLRSFMNWRTPSVNRELTSKLNLSTKDDLNLFDQVLAVARKNGIDSHKLEIRPARNSNEAWLVSEIDRSYPSQVDSVSIDPDQLSIIDKAEFSKFPLMAKLTRWGIDIHMGSLFGLLNQILLVIFSVGISFLGITGYWMWIKRNGWKKSQHVTLFEELKSQPELNISILVFILLSIGLMLPVLLISLIGFMILEEMSKRYL